MTDLTRILPDFPVDAYPRLLPTVERHGLTTCDLLTLDVPEIGKRTQLPLLEIKRLCAAVLDALHRDLGVSARPQKQLLQDAAAPSSAPQLKQTSSELLAHQGGVISTLDPHIDAALGGGVPAGYVTEITGESGAGKTQFLLTLLLACQLPPPHGLGRPALYISTEAPLSTKRLSQMLAGNPVLQSCEEPDRPSLDRIISTITPDLESQDHILSFQVPVEVARRNVGLLVLDSVAANYRVEFERGSGGPNLAARGAELVRLGRQLQDLARKHNLAVVVSNQVADRFAPTPAASKSSLLAMRPSQTLPPRLTQPQNRPPMSQESPLASRSRNAAPAPFPVPPSSAAEPASSLEAEIAATAVRSSMPEPPPEFGPPLPPAPQALLLDHQQRWFTGWGDDPERQAALKTPSLGLVWSTQIAARVALLRAPVYGRPRVVLDDDDGGEAVLRNWRRWMKVVFAPHVPATGQGLDGAVEFEVTMGGIRSVEKERKKTKQQH